MALSPTRKMLTHVRGYHIGKSLSVAADNTWYSYKETGTEGDVWIAIVRGVTIEERGDRITVGRSSEVVRPCARWPELRRPSWRCVGGRARHRAPRPRHEDSAGL